MKYYKGLGTSTAKEAKEYFSDMDLHRIPFQYKGPEDDEAIDIVIIDNCMDIITFWNIFSVGIQKITCSGSEGLDKQL